MKKTFYKKIYSFFTLTTLVLSLFAISFPAPARAAYCDPWKNDVTVDFQIMESGRQISSGASVSGVGSTITLNAVFKRAPGNSCVVDDFYMGFLNIYPSGFSDVGSRSGKTYLGTNNDTKSYSVNSAVNRLYSANTSRTIERTGDTFRVQAYGYFSASDRYLKSDVREIKVGGTAGTGTTNCRLDTSSSFWTKGNGSVTSGPAGTYSYIGKFTSTTGGSCASVSVQTQTHRINGDGTPSPFGRKTVTTNGLEEANITGIRVDYKTVYAQCFSLDNGQSWNMCSNGLTVTTGQTVPNSGPPVVTTGPTPTPPGGSGGPTPTPGTGGTGNNNGSVPSPDAQLYNPIESSNLGQLMLTVMKGFIVIIAAWSVLFIVVGGFRMVMSQGNSEALTKAKATITWAIAGVIVSVLAFSIVAIVQNLVGYKGIPTTSNESVTKIV